MNWQHLRTILWLRWRMSLHQLRRGGLAGTIILAVLAVLAVVAAVSTFFVALLVGSFVLPGASAQTVMYVWDGVVVAFLFFWMIGLLTELRRSEVLSLQKLLHLPISLAGTFLINYLGSLFSLSLIVFLPGMIGLSIALVLVKGPRMLLLFPLLAGFLLMVTALSYQFQGWLATLMVNQRRRRTIIAIVTVSVIVVSQLPNLLNVAFSRSRGWNNQTRAPLREELARLDRALAAGEIDAGQHAQEREAVQRRYQEAVAQRNRQQTERLGQIVARVNSVLPIGWLPYGAMASLDGRVLPAILGALGAGLIGALSLWHSYRTTLRLYTGTFTSGKTRQKPAVVARTATSTRTNLIERRLPGLSEHASAITVANFRSLTRAPEAKMLLLTPAIMVIVFGSMLLAPSFQLPELARPFIGFGAVGMIMLSMMQLVGNQFGLDRDGFRTLVLSASSRRDILLGKNLSIAPLMIGLSTATLGILQAIYPMGTADFLATLVGIASVYLIFCGVGNLTSILAPMPVAAGSLKPAHPKLMAVVIHFLFFLLLPPVFALALVPLLLELLMHYVGWLSGFPIYLMLSLLELGVVVWLYYCTLGWQGRLLQAREQNILAVVTTKVE